MSVELDCELFDKWLQLSNFKFTFIDVVFIDDKEWREQLKIGKNPGIKL